MERFNIKESDVHRCGSGGADMPKNKKICYEIEKWILALVENNRDVEEAIRKFIDANRDTVVICNDISCGVVPSDPVLRKWREAAGRSLAMLSQESDEVIRLFCGIPTKLK